LPFGTQVWVGFVRERLAGLDLYVRQKCVPRQRHVRLVEWSSFAEHAAAGLVWCRSALAGCGSCLFVAAMDRFGVW